MNDEFELVRGSDKPFQDVGIADADLELMKVDRAVGIIRILRERGTSATDASGVAVNNISRVRKAALDSFTVDHPVEIHNRLDPDPRI